MMNLPDDAGLGEVHSGPDVSLEEEAGPKEDMYMAQREELIVRLKRCYDGNESFVLYGRELLSVDEVCTVLQKIRKKTGFSRKERMAITDAGFDLQKLFPDL